MLPTFGHSRLNPFNRNAFSPSKEIGRQLNVEGWKHMRPAPAVGGNGIATALREAIRNRTGRIPEDMEALLLKLERRSVRRV